MSQVFDWVIAFCCGWFFDSLSITFDNLFWRSARLSNINRYLAGYFSLLFGMNHLKMKAVLLLLVASVALGNNNEGLVLEVASFSSLQKCTRTYRKPRKLLNFSEHANKMSDVMRNFEGSIG